jgi:hypothetical protein
MPRRERARQSGESRPDPATRPTRSRTASPRAPSTRCASPGGIGHTRGSPSRTGFHRMHGFGGGRPLAGIEPGGLVGPLLIGSPGTLFELVLQRTRDRAPDELRPLAAPTWRDLLEQRRGLVVELDEQLFHMNDHIIDPSAVRVGRGRAPTTALRLESPPTIHHRGNVDAIMYQAGMPRPRDGFPEFLVSRASAT